MIDSRVPAFNKIVDFGKNILEKEENLELFDRGFLYDYLRIRNELDENLKRAAEAGRELSIGIVGAVKAGKSSFLNALVFEGEQFLPKAITPSTAALTIISYSKQPKAIVHFFSNDDWTRICSLAEVYENCLSTEYQKYCERYEQNKKKKNIELTERLDLERFEHEIFSRTYNDERTKAANELKCMTKGKDIRSSLDTQAELTGNIMKQLKEYIDANGKYTAIVKYVEIFSDNPNLEGLKIVDTPGLCDPVVSRGQATKDYLSKCDVVLLLSACSQFMPADTINLMANSLPNAGVREVLVIGSRYDGGIFNDKGGDFLTKAKKAKESYEVQFARNMEIIHKTGRGSELMSKIEKSPRLYVSSMCYFIERKLKNNQALDKEEANVYRQLKEYDGFKNEYLPAIAGLNEVRIELNKIIKKKEEIIAAKDNDLLNNAANNLSKIIYDIQTYVQTNNIKLRNMSKEEIENQFKKIQDALILSRKELASLFEVVGLQCEKKLISIKSILIQEMANYSSFKILTETSDSVSTVKTGIFKKEAVHITETTKKASTADVKMNLTSYYGRCIQIIDDEFTNLFYKEQFIRSIKEIIMKAYDSGNSEYEKEDILLPVNVLLAKLEIPQVEVDINPYIDVVNSHFADGFATNNEIHELSSVQTEQLSKLSMEFQSQVQENGKKITNIMNEESVSFANNLEEKFAGDRETLLKQMEDQKKYIELNAEFSKVLKSILDKLKEYTNAI